MIVEFIKPASCLGFERKLTLKTIKRSKEGITFDYMNKTIFIPWSNVVAIQENNE